LKCADELMLGRDTPDHHVEISDDDDDEDEAEAEAEWERRDAGWTVASR
jgi:hypothetical protein